MQTADSNHKKGYKNLAILLAIFVAAVAVFFHLFAERFAAGNIYPRYSTLRKDGFGTKILFKSFEEAGYSVHRNYREVSRIKPVPASTYFLVGIAGDHYSSLVQSDEHQELLMIPASGARLVLTLLPAGSKKKVNNEADQEQDQQVDGTEKEEEQEPQDTGCENCVLDLSLDHFEEEGEKGQHFHTTALGQLGDHYVQTPWYSAAYFVDLPAEWRVILTIQGQPVLIERAWGKGSLVVAADSHFLSNEGIRHARDPYLLAWLSGGGTSIFFDEAHHGIRQQVAVGSLIRDFKLYWVFVALLIPALLFVIRCSRPLLPPMHNVQANGANKEGRDQFSGLVNILRKHPPENLLGACVSVWCKANQGWCRKNPDRVSEMKLIAGSTKSTELVDNYNKIASLVQKRQPTIKTIQTGTNYE